MKVANISYTKNHLSELLNCVREGDSVLIVDRKKPVARLEPVGDAGVGQRPAWVEDLIRRGIMVPARQAPDPNLLKRLPPGRVRRGGDIVRALQQDREDRF